MYTVYNTMYTLQYMYKPLTHIHVLWYIHTSISLLYKDLLQLKHVYLFGTVLALHIITAFMWLLM